MVIMTIWTLCRQKVAEIEELRKAVKQEAGTLKKQLKEVVHLSDDSLKRVTI